MRPQARARIGWIAIAASIALPAAAQSTLYTVDGSTSFYLFGESAAGMGDIDGDGVGDLAVGGSMFGYPAGYYGRVELLSGVDGSVITTITGTGGMDMLGASVDGAGDVDGDGVPDVIIGARQDTPYGSNPLGPGYALVVSGATKQVIRRWTGTAIGADFGHAVAGLGDVDGDGTDDVAVSAPHMPNNLGPAYVQIFSGQSGAVLHTLVSGAPDDWFGFAVSSAGDVDGDGRPDVLIGGGIGQFGERLVRVYSGATGGLVAQFSGQLGGGDSFGASVGAAGDVDSDGHADVLVGADGALDGRGYVALYSGGSGQILYQVSGDTSHDYFGYRVVGGLDLDGDGVPDFAVGAVGVDHQASHCGAVRVFSGASGEEMYTVYGDSKLDSLGTAVDLVSDLDGDGRPDLVAGATNSQAMGYATGSIRAYHGASCSLPAVYCTAKVNSLGCLPEIGSTGRPSVSDPTPFTIEASQVLNNKPAVLFYGYSAQAVPFQGGTLCIGPPVRRTAVQSTGGNPPPLDCSGTLSFDFNALIQSGADPQLAAGVLAYAQYWYRDAQSPLPAGLTDALRFSPCP